MWSPRTCLYLFRMPMLGSKNGLFQTLDSIKDFLFRLLFFRSHMPPSNNLKHPHHIPKYFSKSSNTHVCENTVLS